MEDIWQAVLDEIQIEVSKPTYLTFFQNTYLISLENDIATIGAPTYITAQYIEKRYYALIKKSLDKKVNKNVSLIFSTATRERKLEKDIGPLFTPMPTIEKRTPRPERVRVDYTFATFAVSESNQLAYTAGLTVAGAPGGIYNPLFIYGTVGVGKTHLMCAIANKVLEVKSDAKILYLTTEEFTNEVVESIKENATNKLRKKFRNVDVLLLDDIQFLTGKEKVQEELFHTFNTLIDKGGQIIFTSDRPPSEIRKIESRLASRFEGGLTVDVAPPDFELRAAITLIKSEKHHIPLSTDIAKIIAEHVQDARALEGFLLRLSAALVRATSKDVSKELVLSLLQGAKKRTQVASPDAVVEAVCNYYNIKTTQIKGSKRDASLVRARHVCMYLLKEQGLTLVEIGNLLGGRDHTTVMHGVEKIEFLIQNNEEKNGEIVSIKRVVESATRI
ncbi:MAG: chromosomal replication initiator protein DnaA [Candidatus Levybacteria bacterium]|nr:chromosomal replication initiator protein DnaA [Candidatus Levybacteria bacterium]